MKIIHKFIHFFTFLTVKVITVFIGLKNDAFFFVSMNGSNYGDNMKSISDYIAKLYPTAKIIWAFSPSFIKQTQCNHKSVIINSFSFYFYLHTSKYIFNNVGFNYTQFWKRKGQIVVNTWHGTALKRIGKDVYANKNMWSKLFGYLHTRYNAGLIDVFVSGSRFMTNIYHEKLLIKKKIYEFGTPRNDIFFQGKKDIINNVKKKFGISEHQKIILYAPTFRSNNSVDYYNLDLNKMKNALTTKTNDDYRVMVRLHPKFIGKESFFSPLLSQNVINASLFPNMQELLCAVDVLITDYSSSIFDFMYTKKPIFLYIPDWDVYDRGFYFRKEELPFTMIENNSEIDDVVMKFQYGDYVREVERFIEKIGSVEDGLATQRLCSLLLN